MKLELKKKGWDDVSISDYKRIVEIMEDTETEPYIKNMKVLALLCDVDEQTIWNTDIKQINALTNQTSWVDNFNFKQDSKYKKIKIGDEECAVTTDLKKFSIAQYIDFQTYYGGMKLKNPEQVLSTFVIPKGHKYNDGYDIIEFQRLIADNISIKTSNEMCFFLYKKLLSSTKTTLLSWEVQIWMMMILSKGEKRKKLKEAIRKMRETRKMLMDGTVS